METGMPQPVEFTPIGVVRSPVAELGNLVWGGVRCHIELDDSRFTPDSVQGLTDFSHLEIVFFFHRAPETPQPQTRVGPDAVGMFAQRGKNRPNPIGVTICRLLSVDRLSLEVVGLDAIDGTPVLDVKPWMKEFAARGEVRQPKWVDELMRGYWENTYFG
jgi:tRNA-Thr(GGU) m(6)t(6)A37 methyltransferase TsaA